MERKKEERMITVNVKQLVGAIEEAERYSLPEMDSGTRYLYDELYRTLSEGLERRLSEINFGGFGLDDIESLRDIYSETLEGNARKAEALARSLREISPVAAVSAFV